MAINEGKRGSKSSTNSKALSENQKGLWNQLGNAVSMAAKEDQIIWTIFSVFWAANAVLMVGLFTTGMFPEPPVGIAISAAGAILSWLWFFIQRRAIGWLVYYEKIIQEIEQEHLAIPREIALTGYLNDRKYKETIGQGIRVRPLMIVSGVVTATLWTIALGGFLCQAIKCMVCS